MLFYIFHVVCKRESVYNPKLKTANGIDINKEKKIMEKVSLVKLQSDIPSENKQQRSRVITMDPNSQSPQEQYHTLVSFQRGPCIFSPQP